MTRYVQRVVVIWFFMMLVGVKSALCSLNVTLMQDSSDYGKSWMFFPNDKGFPTIAYLSEDGGVGYRQFQEDTYAPPENLDDKVIFHLYTSKKSLSTSTTLPNSHTAFKNLDLRKNVKVVTHGYLSDSSSRVCQLIKDAYVDQGDTNVIIVDWGELAGNILYPTSAANTQYVGQQVGKFLDRLIEKGADASKIHLIGHSLGSHVSGYAGRLTTKGRIGRITGLDPARPMFVNSDLIPLKYSDANFVDVIHTCSNLLGFADQLGHADFYPNGGLPPQPGCLGFVEIVQGCSHGRSYEYFAESIDKRNRYTALKCPSWEDYTEKRCEHESAMMGEYVKQTANGKYYLHTNPKSPYPAAFNF